MNKNETTKVDREMGGVPLETASPIGQEELEQQVAREEMETRTPPKPLRADDQKEKKPLEPDQPLNPKRTQNSRPD